MEIKAIDWNEIRSIKPLWKGLNAHHLLMSTNFKHFYSDLPFEKRMQSLGRRDRLITFIAQNRSETIGYCIASIDNHAGEIDSIFIQEHHRRTGVGREWINVALRWFENQGCETIRVAIAEGNEASIGFYKRCGFAERMIIMQKTA
jgi:ribosomal protein S18 acetylase RimI-like enzyme